MMLKLTVGLLVLVGLSAATYIGCFRDARSRDLPRYTNMGSRATNTLCKSICANTAYRYAGTQYWRECWCGDSVGRYGAARPDSECRATCLGNRSTKCGYHWRNSVHESGYLGCYRDSRNRVLPVLKYLPGGMTQAKCIAYCKGRGFLYAGTQWYNECWCGNGNIEKHGSQLSKYRCNTRCRGDSKQFCGGPWALSVHRAKEQACPRPSGYRG